MDQRGNSPKRERIAGDILDFDADSHGLDFD
jgi:hypothetical protein